MDNKLALRMRKGEYDVWPGVSSPWVKGMSADIDPFDLDAAILRKSEADMRAFLSALATRLDTALPNRVKVERKRDGLFSSTTHVVRIELTTDTAAYTLSFESAGLKASRAKIVRGVTISSAAIPAMEWMSEVRGAVSRLSGEAGDASDAIGGFL